MCSSYYIVPNCDFLLNILIKITQQNGIKLFKLLLKNLCFILVLSKIYRNN